MRLAAIAVVAACAPPPAEPLLAPPITTPPAEHDVKPNWLPELLASPRPAIDVSQWVPDVEAEARWPLGFNEHPEAEPSFDIAGALADPGVTWRELCTRGVQFGHRAKDQDLIAYLKVWCTEDPGDALYQLGLLRNSAIRGISAAIVADSARIVVGHVSADVAEGLLTRSQLASTALFDLVAASYLEVGKLDDALAMNRLAEDSDRTRVDATTCHRIVRAIVGTTGEAQDAAVAELRRFAEPPKTLRAQLAAPRDPTCIALDADVACWRMPSDCLRANLGNSKVESLLLAYGRWPSQPAAGFEWRKIADYASEAMPGDEAYALLSRALELAVATSRCDAHLLGVVEWKLGEVRAQLGSTSPYDARLAAFRERVKHLGELSSAQCAEELARR
jgi:hypothetical protein